MATVFLLFATQISQAKKEGPGLSQSAVIFKHQQVIFDKEIDEIWKICLTGHGYKLTVDSTSNLKIEKDGQSNSITIDRSNALSSDQFLKKILCVD
jgi:hypothetical protein